MRDKASWTKASMTWWTPSVVVCSAAVPQMGTNPGTNEDEWNIMKHTSISPPENHSRRELYWLYSFLSNRLKSKWNERYPKVSSQLQSNRLARSDWPLPAGCQVPYGRCGEQEDQRFPGSAGIGPTRRLDQCVRPDWAIGKDTQRLLVQIQQTVGTVLSLICHIVLTFDTVYR